MLIVIKSCIIVVIKSCIISVNSESSNRFPS